MSQHVVPYQENEDADYDELEDDVDGEDTSNFHVMNRLPAPSAVMYRMEDLHKLMHIGEIDLDPPYQRDVVWPENKQIKLIDSLYHNYYIPPVVFTVFTVNDYEVRRCVDGKQRLTAIRKFIDGQIPYRDPVTRQAFWYTTSVPNRQEVPEVWKRDFANKLITSVEYRGLPDGLERDIFQRVQLGIPLTAAEKLQAHSSPWAQYISHLTSSFINSDTGLTNHIELDTSRGRDFQAIAQMVFCCDGLPEQRFPTAHKLDVWLQQTEPPKKAFKDAVKECLRVFRFVASTPGYDVGFKEVKNRVAPAEFVFIGVLIYVMRGCDHETIADAILAMRQDARVAYKDIRANTFVVKHLWGFISRKAEELDTGVYVESQGGKKGKGGKPIPRGKKRARKEEDEGREVGESKKALTAQ